MQPSESVAMDMGAAASVQRQAALGDLPEWDLSDLYPGRDSEVLTLAICAEWGPWDSERGFWRFACQRLRHLFPSLLSVEDRGEPPDHLCDVTQAKDVHGAADGAEGHELLWYATQELSYVAGEPSGG